MTSATSQEKDTSARAANLDPRVRRVEDLIGALTEFRRRNVEKAAGDRRYVRVEITNTNASSARDPSFARVASRNTRVLSAMTGTARAAGKRRLRVRTRCVKHAFRASAELPWRKFI